MARQICVLCNKNKTSLFCDSCGDVSCKNCVEFIDEDHFEWLSLLPDDLKNRTFCRNCYNQGIDDRIIRYRDIAEKAKKVDVFSKTQTKETRRIKRVEDPIRVVDCEDKAEALLKLAFITADKGFDTIIDTEITSKKVGEGKSYKKLIWSGTGVPADPSLKK